MTAGLVAPLTAEEVFVARGTCPFCGAAPAGELDHIDYRDTAEANQALPDIRGTLFECLECGVAFPSHAYRVTAFPLLYSKTFQDLDGFDRSPLQRVRTAVMARILAAHHRRVSLSRLLDALTCRVLQVPALGRAPRGLSILDVGCGFGEFVRMFSALGNEVVGTEIVPAFVDRLRAARFDCRLGELHDLDFDGQRFDAVILRAVLYRTLDVAATLGKVDALLAPGGEIVLVDPCPGRDGASYFFRKQFPQGQFYIIDRGRYFAMLTRRFRLACAAARLIYGRPNAPLKPLSPLVHVRGLGELVAANLLHRKPYVLSYRLVRAS